MPLLLASRFCPRPTVYLFNALTPPRCLSPSISLSTIRILSVNTGILPSICPSTRTGTVPWPSSPVPGLFCFSFLQLYSPNSAPDAMANECTLHENVLINTSAIRRLHLCAPRPPLARSSENPSLMLNYTSSTSRVPPLNSHTSSPRPPQTCLKVALVS